jgi:hypothetical protein
MSRFVSDLVTIDELANDLGRHPRTILRWKASIRFFVTFFAWRLAICDYFDRPCQTEARP